jgi:hypothetical protein
MAMPLDHLPLAKSNALSPSTLRRIVWICSRDEEPLHDQSIAALCCEHERGRAVLVTLIGIRSSLDQQACCLGLSTVRSVHQRSETVFVLSTDGATSSQQILE